MNELFLCCYGAFILVAWAVQEFELMH